MLFRASADSHPPYVAFGTNIHMKPDETYSTECLFHAEILMTEASMTLK